MPTGPETRALSSWFGLNPAHQSDNWPVAQLVGNGNITVSEGTSREFNDHGSAETSASSP